MVCVNLSRRDIEELKALKEDIPGIEKLSNITLNTIVGTLGHFTKVSDLSKDKLKEKVEKILEHSKEIEKKRQQLKVLQKAGEGTIGTNEVPVTIGNRWFKSSPSSNSNTLYVYAENAQAYNANEAHKSKKISFKDEKGNQLVRPVPSEDKASKIDTKHTVEVHYSNSKNKELSNFAERKFTFTRNDFNDLGLDTEKDITFASVEQAFQWAKMQFAATKTGESKFSDQADAILKETKGTELRKLGREVVIDGDTLEEWGNVKEDILYSLMLQSFKQDATARELLLKTGNKKITHSVKDEYSVTFPKLLMAVREELSDTPNHRSRFLNVKGTSAVVRAHKNAEGEVEFNENALPIVTKMNAYDEHSTGNHFTNNDEDQLPRDASHAVAVTDMWVAQINSILETANSGKYDSIELPATLGGSKARLSRDQAETLADLIVEKLGIYAEAKQSGKVWYVSLGDAETSTTHKKASKKTAKDNTKPLGKAEEAPDASQIVPIADRHSAKSLVFPTSVKEKGENKPILYTFKDGSQPVDISGLTIEAAFQKLLGGTIEDPVDKAQDINGTIFDPSKKTATDIAKQNQKLLNDLYKLYWNSLDKKAQEAIADMYSGFYLDSKELDEKTLGLAKAKVSTAEALLAVLGKKKLSAKEKTEAAIKRQEQDSRPLIDNKVNQMDDDDILTKAYPDLRERMEITRHMVSLFSGRLTLLMQASKQLLSIANRVDEEGSPTVAGKILQVLETGTEEEQRVAFLKMLPEMTASIQNSLDTLFDFLKGTLSEESKTDILEEIKELESPEQQYKWLLNTDNYVRLFGGDKPLLKELLKNNLGEEASEYVEILYKHWSSACIVGKDFLDSEYAPIKSSIQIMLNSIKNYMEEFIVDDVDSEDAEIPLYTHFLHENNGGLESDTYNNFQEQLKYQGITNPAEQRQLAKIQLDVLSETYRKLLDPNLNPPGSMGLFAAILKEAAFTLEFTENIRIQVSDNTLADTYDSINAKDLNEDNVDANKEGYMVKYKLMPPSKTLSVRIKKLLSTIPVCVSQPQIVNGKIVGYQPRVSYDKFGQKETMDPNTAFYILVEEFSGMTCEEDFTKIFDKVTQKYPQFDVLREYIFYTYSQDENDKEYRSKFEVGLRNELYGALRKANTTFSMTDGRGFLTALNKSASSEVFLQEMKKMYGGRVRFTDGAIYDENGKPDKAHIEALRSLFVTPQKALRKVGLKEILKKQYKKEDLTSGEQEALTQCKENHPISYALWVLDILANTNNKDPKISIDTIQEALEILRGDYNLGNINTSEIPEGADLENSSTIKNKGLEYILQSLGVNTSNIDVNLLIPSFTLEGVSAYMEAQGKPIAPENITPRMIKTYLQDEQYGAQLKGYKERVSETIMEVARAITDPDKGFGASKKDTPDLVQDFSNYYLRLGTALQLASEDYTESSFRHGDTTRQTYAAPDFIQTMVTSIASKEAQKAEQFINENYGRYSFFKSSDGKWMNTWCEDWMNNTELREAFTFQNVLSLGGSEKKHTIGKTDPKNLLKHLIYMYWQGGHTKQSKIPLGWYRCSLLSDTDALIAFKNQRFRGANYQEEILNRLVAVVNQEIERANHLQGLREGSVNIEFYNKRGMQSQFFPELNAVNTNGHTDFDILRAYFYRNESNPYYIEDPLERQQEIKKVLKALLEKKFKQFYEALDEEDKSEIYSTYTQLAKRDVDTETTTDSDSKQELSDEDEEEHLKGLLQEFYYNDFYAQSQIIQLFGGDLAYYKNFRDFIKRNKQCYACGDRIWSKNEKGEPINETCLYAEDLDMVSNTWSSINTLLKADDSLTSMEKAVLRGAANSFLSITATDGQSFRTLKSFKKIFEAMGGKWTDSMEEAYQALTTGNFDREEGKGASLVSYLQQLWQPIKPFVFSHEDRVTVDKKGNVRTEKVVTQHKNSEYMINAVYSMLNIAMNKSPELLALHQFMIDNDIDVVHFHSVVKEGYNCGVDINHNPEKFNALKETQGAKQIIRLKDSKGHVLQDSKGNDIIISSKGKTLSYGEYLKGLKNLLTSETITQEDYNKAVQDCRHTINLGDSTNREYRTRTIRNSSAYKALQQQVGKLDIEGNPKMQDGKLVTNPNYMHVIPLKDYMKVQPTEDHLVDMEALYGSQLRNIITADLPETFTMTVTVGNKSKTLNREEAVKYYNTLLVDTYLNGFKTITGEFADIHSLQKKLFAMMEGNAKYGDDIKRALEIDEETGTFKLPFNSPTLANKIEELMLSTFKNSIQKQKIKGGNAVLVSNYGLHDDLKIEWQDVEVKDADGKPVIDYDENGNPVPRVKKAIKYIECYLPYTEMKQLEDFCVEKDDHWEINMDKAKKVLKGKADELFNVIGYRIPTEDKYSIMCMRIKGFLPAASGGTIMLPSDIITMSGTDFKQY